MIEWVLILPGLAAVGLYYLTREASEVLPNLPAPSAHLAVTTLVREGEEASELGAWTATEIHRYTGLEVEVRPSLKLPAGALHVARGQYDAVHLARILEGHCGPGEVLLGLTEYDLFSSDRPNLSFALGGRLAHTGVVSVCRMGGADPEETLLRFKKMALRYVGEMVFKLPRSADPASMLYGELQRPSDFDRMELRF